MNRRIGLVLCVLAFLTMAVAPAFAAKGGGSSSISLVMPYTLASDGLHVGDQVTFAVRTTATAEPWVNANCYQGKTLVYSEWHGFFDRYLFGQTFTLGPTRSWQSGGADCVANLVSRDNYRTRVLASTSFHVDG